MKSENLIILLSILFFYACEATEKNSQGESFLSKVDQIQANIVDDSALLTFFDKDRAPLSPAFHLLPDGSNRPNGWLLEIMKQDLETGIVGALDEFYPGIKADDLYRTARRGGLEDVPEMGDLVLTGEPWEASIMWWNSETAGNWWDGFVRHAFLTDNKEAMAQSRAIVQNLLDSQDEDGYIGIYKPNLRYQHEGSNGELWSQTTAFRTLLGYYEITGEQQVLEAVEKAMRLTMKQYGPEGRNPFYLKNAFGGVTHGLMMTDVCETLYRITGKQEYQDYATYLYQAFSTYSINRAFNDLRYPFLLNRDTLFSGHAVHTYEHLRTLLNAYYATGYQELEIAWNNAMHKLDHCLLPSGAGHGNEWIAELEADPDYTSTEFCTMLELRNSFASIVEKTGELKYADLAEKLTFNGIMGFRNEDGTAITYGKSDNCYVLDGKHHGVEGAHDDIRYKYSPTHSDPAVCCVPNYTRNFTYYLDQMWMKKEDGLAAVLYGPSTLTTEWEGTEITIEAITNYPFSDKIEYRIISSQPQQLALYFRKPAWASSMTVQQKKGAISDIGDFYKIEKEWASGDLVVIQFDNDIQLKTHSEEHHYFQRGPLVFAYEIPHREETIKTYADSDFSDYFCFPTDQSYEGLMIASEQVNAFQWRYDEAPLGKNFWHQNPPVLVGNLVGKEQGLEREIRLVPMGTTVLRKTSFPVRRE